MTLKQFYDWQTMGGASDVSRKDLTDISRLLEAHPVLKDRIPQNILDRLET